MEGGDPDAPTHKRPRLDSVYNGLPPPPHPPHTQPTGHPPTGQASSPPPPTRSYPHPPPGLPPPSQSFPPPATSHYQTGPLPSPSAPSGPPSDIRAYQSPRALPSPGQRPHGVNGHPVTLPARTVSQDSISNYPPRQPPTQQSTAPEPQSSRAASVDARYSGMDHGNHQHWSVNPEHRHGSIPNGLPVVSPPLEQQYQGGYGQPVNAYPSGPYIGPAGGYQSPSASQIRRKQVRATQACNHCRARKQKCDEARPCQFCRENNFDCQYKDVPPPKQDRSMMQLQDSVNNVSDVLKDFVASFNTWKDSVESRLPPPGASNIVPPAHHPSPEFSQTARGSFSEQSHSRMPTPVQARGQLHRVNSMKTESPTVPPSHMSPRPAHAGTPIKQETLMPAPQQPATPAESVRTEHENTDDGSKDKKGLMGDHTTPAHQLLDEWPSMREFTDDIPAIKKLVEAGYSITDYPMQLEQQRGLLRVWGMGEGHDLNDGAHGPGSPESNNDSDAPSPGTVKEGLWGPNNAPSPSTIGADSPQDHENVGGLGPDGRPQLDESTLWTLHNLYYKNFHCLHPFLNPSKLRKMIKEFSEIYSPRPSNAFSPGSAVPNHVAGVKRKRSSSTFALDPWSPGRAGRDGPETIEKSLRNAIVLLVLALGKVSQYKKPLPAPQKDKLSPNVSGLNHDSPFASNVSFSSDDGADVRPRNIDSMPGMAYFSYATDILGNQQGGNTIGHAQAMLLAALYLGQFARVLESWSWINNACRVCLILIKADMPKINRSRFFDNSSVPRPPQNYSPKENYRLNLIKCVYWTCLQLETDILAEMSTLPPTDISKHQEDIAYPSGVYESLPDSANFDSNNEHEKTMWTYSSQIHLRVILNEAHNTLYGASHGPKGKKPPGLDVKNLKEVANAARVHADILLSWRRLLPQQLSWTDDEIPSTDINIARLRAKFYGGHYMILRPFLFLAVHEIELPPGPPVSSSWNSQTSSPVSYSDSVGTPTAHQRGLMDYNPEQSGVLHVAFQCINSAVASTIAFDRVGEKPDAHYEAYVTTPSKRLVVTNIFGTLHAQFGNMIVLAAVYNSRLRSHLPRDNKLTKANLKLLFRRTIKVLEGIAPNSPVLRVDADILKNVQRMISLES
ncbi:hypothetical protein BDV96DRAFT_646544 [Lophiotrema nucula]|uniref:Zn(2)-C6 fungal-type domain-containing protein n=1 Tax=Lophiotrema nucula TaxID=690887 RepID=A0A6A5Z806_9PLEO|nr:hypothetical protein BDV96DRAFT_646544 [Lophiotrema nucula]